MSRPNITVPLWPHQRQMVDFAIQSLRRRGYAFWVAGCATGKTLAAYTVAAELGVSRTLVLTKKTIIEQAWVGNANRLTKGFTVLPLTKGSSKDKLALVRKHLADPNLVVIVNYETAALLAQYIPTLGFDLVVADESHHLKSHNSKQSMALALACQNIKYKIAMTGTPFDDRPTDVFGQVRWFAPYKSGRVVASRILGTWSRFFDEYVVYRSVDNIKIPIRYKNQEQLRTLIDPFTIYLNSEDVLTLPPELDIDWPVAWTPELRRVYRDVEVEMLAEFDEDTLVADNVLVKTLRLHQLTGGYFQGEESGQYITTPKATAVLDIMDEIGGKPTVVFTQFETDVMVIQPMLEAAGYNVKLLVGGTYQHEEFQNGDGDVILVNLAAGNAGIELTRARYCIYYSIGTSRTNYSQSRYRVRRPGSDVKLPIVYYHLLLPGSMDVELHNAMQSKGTVADYLLEGLKNRVS